MEGLGIFGTVAGDIVAPPDRGPAVTRLAVDLAVEPLHHHRLRVRLDNLPALVGHHLSLGAEDLLRDEQMGEPVGFEFEHLG